MPYAKTSELPAGVKARYTAKQRRAYMKAFNDAVSRGEDEETAHKIAHRAAQRAGERDAVANSKAAKKARESSIVVIDRTELEERLRAFYGRPERALVGSADDTREALHRELRSRFGGSGSHVWVRDFGDDWVAYEVETAEASRVYKLGYGEDGGALVLRGEPEEVQVSQRTEFVPVQRAFMAEVNGKTILTGQVLPELATSENEHFLALQGAFVGGEKPNRNGAFWSTGDLEMGEPTVRYGPLNWLHDDRHIVGTIADAKLVHPAERESATLRRSLAGIEEPYILASSVMWKFLWPTESALVEQAAAQGQLWYSMECISKQVACLADDCGTTVSYMASLSGEGVCDHLREKAARRYVDPTFLGGAVVLPPMAPGWADAHVDLMRQAASLAEPTYEQAGRPSVDDGVWERLVACIVDFATPLNGR